MRRPLLARVAVATLVVAAAHLVEQGTASAATCEEVAPAHPGCIEVLSWDRTVDESTLTIYRLPQVGQYIDPGGMAWAADFTPFCRVNVDGPRVIDDVLCEGALRTCERLGSDARVAMWMVLTPLFAGPNPQLEGPICFANSSAIPIGPIIQKLVEQEIGTDPPPIVLQPTDAIVNLPLIASTDPRAPIVIDITDPIIGTAQATPEFVWTFAADAAAHGPGLPYDGTSPTENPGYYVAYTYRALGSPTVVLTVTWRVTFTIPGYPPVPLEDVVRTAEQSTQVRAAGSELIGG